MKLIVLFIIILFIIILEIIRKTLKKSKDIEFYGFNEIEEEIIKYEDDIEDTEQEYEHYPYVKKYLLTRNEYNFYCNLKKITEKYNYQILAKIRLADLVEVQSDLSKSEFFRYFSKIKSKHIDFAITDDMNIITLIEVDDKSHNSYQRKERDRFIDNVLYITGYNIIRTYGDTKKIDSFLKNQFYMN